MFTLIYINGKLNRPDTLSTFLHSNVGKCPMLQVDCVTPYLGTEQELVTVVCEYLNCIDPQIKVTYSMTQNVSSENTKNNKLVHFLVMQICVNSLC